MIAKKRSPLRVRKIIAQHYAHPSQSYTTCGRLVGPSLDYSTDFDEWKKNVRGFACCSCRRYLGLPT